MKFSLLYKNPELRLESEMDFEVLYDISIDRTINSICSDSRRADYFLAVLAKPLKSVTDVIYRQEILYDLRNIPKLHDDLKLIFNRYDKVKNDWQELRTNAYPAGSSVNYRALLDYTFASLKITSLFPKTIISFFKSIYETLDKYKITSEALINIRDYCRGMCINDSLAELASIASLFQYYSPEQFSFSLLAELDETLLLSSCELCGITEVSDRQSENPLKRFFRAKKNTEQSYVEVESDEDAENDTIYMLNEALHRVDLALTKATGDVYDIFWGLSHELYFYEVALTYCNALEDGGYKICTPKILPCEDNLFNAEQLCDLLLISEGKRHDEISGNNIILSDKRDGILLRGPNKTGKTSYLRAAAAAQIFAQAGLPVCASNAIISIRNAVFSHFSSAEEEFKAGDTAGRFEGEVQAIARIIDKLVPYSIIYLNETFQTTSYSEGAQGIHHILAALPSAETKFMFVTKLTKLFDMANPEKVTLLQTGGVNPFKVE